MPLLDHFQPPLSVSHPWKGFHSAWANAITNQLNEVLPEGYYAIPEVPLGDQVEIDVATLEQPAGAEGGAGPATVVWAPPQPRLSAPVWIDVDVCLALPLEASYEAACHSLRITR